MARCPCAIDTSPHRKTMKPGNPMTQQFRHQPAMATLAAVIALLAAPVAHAQTKMQPGLWEHTVTVKDNGEMAAAMQAMQARLANLPAAQRKQMEQMMGQQGIAIAPGAGGATSIRTCMTQAQIDMNDMPQRDRNCSHQAVQRSGNTLKTTFSCTGNPPSSGESEVTVLSPTAYTGKSVITTAVTGKPERTAMDQKGKWLSADCGSIKPVGAPKK
ncbi:MAG: DUF3617 domain-containing protein [Comamonadaceae bacterium]|nr:MAG: DUF3617 domain-containing protein [Comamonadaceae bacterium]